MCHTFLLRERESGGELGQIHGCGEEVSLVEREGGDAIECKGEGCETL